jgi:hypothetical protein
MKKPFIFLLLFSQYANANDHSSHVFANIIIFLTIAILGYLFFGIKKLFSYIKKSKNIKNSKSNITFQTIQNTRHRVVDLIFSTKTLCGTLIFYVILIASLSNNGKDFWNQVQFFIFNSRTILLVLFSWIYVISQIYLINSSFSLSKKYGRFQVLLPIFLFLLIISYSLIENHIFSESFMLAIFITIAIIIVINLIQASLIYIFKND